VTWRLARVVALVAVVAAAAALPWYMASNDVFFWSGVVTTALFAVAVSFAVGFGGIAAFGNQLFFGAAGYTVGWLILHTSFNYVIPLLLLSAGIGIVLALVISPLLRGGRGFAFGMISLALGQLAFLFVIQANRVPGGSDGLFGITRGQLFGLNLYDEGTFYELCLATLGLSVVCLVAIRRSMVGRAISSIRDSAERASALGVPVWRYQSLAFAISGAFTAVAGCLETLRVGAIAPSVFYWSQGATPVLAGLIGGIRTVAGPILGSVVYGNLQHEFQQRTPAWELWVALCVVTIALVAPRGLVSLVDVARDLWANRHDWRRATVGTVTRRLRTERA
jgi:branched-chain amino acid transport system permease protein